VCQCVYAAWTAAAAVDTSQIAEQLHTCAGMCVIRYPCGLAGPA
jgi:hypothetical protein